MSSQHNFSDVERKMSVRDIGLSRKATLSLLQNNVETLQDLLDVIDLNQLKDLYNVGPVRIKEINDKLAEIQTIKYHDFKEHLTTAEKRKDDINKQIEKYKQAIFKLENEAKYTDKMIETIRKNYEQTKEKQI